MQTASDSLWYFAYGSNMQTATFRGRRGIEYRAAVAVRAPGWRLCLDKPPLLPVGESFAHIVPDPAAEVLGVAYGVGLPEIEHIDLTEGVAIGNYQRIELEVWPLVAAHALPAPWRAHTLVSELCDPALRPSRRYMACLIAGAEEHGLPAEYVARLRAIAVCEESDEARRLRPLLDRFMKRPKTA